MKMGDSWGRLFFRFTIYMDARFQIPAFFWHDSGIFQH